MKLLVFTQKVDSQDPILGFFHQWIIVLSQQYEEVIVICLGKGIYSLPNNVKIFSLGGEKKFNKLQKIGRFFYYLLILRSSYDAVFVHMNKEYIILGWCWWKLIGKKLIFWYNHPYADMVAIMAGYMADVIMYTSPQSYFARLGRGVQMPVGIDTNLFTPSSDKQYNNFAYIGRISPVKNIEVIIDAILRLHETDQSVRLTIYGGVLARDQVYGSDILNRVRASGGVITWEGEIINTMLPYIYNKHRAVINMTDTGSFDKVIFEAASCGTLVVSSNEGYHTMVPSAYQSALCPLEIDSETLVSSLDQVNVMTEEKIEEVGSFLRAEIVASHSLEKLVSKLFFISESKQ